MRGATGGRVGGRRAEYAAATRAAMVAAARTLFAERGYFATRVDDVAELARVSPATVYAVVGGKQGLLETLIEAWSTAPELAPIYEEIGKLDDPDTVLARTASGTRHMREEWGDVLRVALGVAAHDEATAAAVARATERYRAGCAVAARRLAELGALRDGMDVDGAVDVLWFYFGYAGYETLVRENGWSLAAAQDWLHAQARHALLGA